MQAIQCINISSSTLNSIKFAENVLITIQSYITLSAFLTDSFSQYYFNLPILTTFLPLLLLFLSSPSFSLLFSHQSLYNVHLKATLKVDYVRDWSISLICLEGVYLVVLLECLLCFLSKDKKKTLIQVKRRKTLQP